VGGSPYASFLAGAAIIVFARIVAFLVLHLEVGACMSMDPKCKLSVHVPIGSGPGNVGRGGVSPSPELAVGCTDTSTCLPCTILP
jgi:hypothetical protein